MMDEFTVYPLGRQIGLRIRQCHTSSIRIMEAREDTPLELCTGYVYDIETMVWTRHSWAIHKKDKILLESTPFTFNQYFGVVLTGVEFQQFKEIIAYKG